MEIRSCYSPAPCDPLRRHSVGILVGASANMPAAAHRHLLWAILRTSSSGGGRNYNHKDNFVKRLALVIIAGLIATTAYAIEAPDILLRHVTDDLINAIRQDKDIHDGNVDL
jgi:hypothetical protein